MALENPTEMEEANYSTDKRYISSSRKFFFFEGQVHYFNYSVERKYGNELFTLKTSPSNGKTRMSSSFLYTTASIGPDSHLFVKSNNKRIHSSENVSCNKGCPNIGIKSRESLFTF